MKPYLLPLLCVGLLLVGYGVAADQGVTRIADQAVTRLDVDGQEVVIARDEYGVPHVFAEANKALFTGSGYAVAQDRLWQLELFRHAAQGRLAELLGGGTIPTNMQIGQLTALDADRDIRTRHYTNAELQEQLTLLNAEEQEIFSAYADGINRYVNDVVAADPASKLPFEFHALGIGVPLPWTVLDVVANAVYQTRFGQAGGQERQNQALLTYLIGLHGSQPAGLGIFNDLRWVDDPDAPVSVPAEETVDNRQRAQPPVAARLEQLRGAGDTGDVSPEERADAVLRALGVPLSAGSHAWVVSAAKSVNGSAMLFGGPQVEFNAPELFHEVHLKGGNGFNVMGRVFAGVPFVYAGRTDHLTWAMTSGTFGDSRDIYIETLCDNGTGYLFNGDCTPFETRTEVIKVKGSSSVNLTVRRTIHGPVVFTPPAMTGVVFTQKRVVWKREIESAKRFLAINRAKNLHEFEAAVRQLEISHHFLYGDRVGNIAYWMSGTVPVRPSGFDPRLPLPGTGNAEWTGEYRPIPFSVNPARGWLSSWNTKPTVGYPNPDQRSFGKQFRSLDIDDHLSTGPISLDGMKAIAEDIARVPTSQGPDGRDFRYLKPYLLSALDAVPPTHPLALQARTVLENWDGSLFADAVTSATLEPGHVIFARWLAVMFVNTFSDELGLQISQASANLLIHVLDDAVGTGSGVPPSRDYFNGVDPKEVMSTALDQALAAGEPDVVAWWSTQPRDIVSFRHTLPAVGEMARMLDANRAAYAYVVVLSNPTPTSQSILSLGQSGFIRLDATTNTPVLDPHVLDQFELFRNFQYKPMRLYRNAMLGR